MIVAYYLNNSHEDNLFCRISDGNQSEFFPLGYTIVDEEWDEDNQEPFPDDPYFYTLIRFREYLAGRYELHADRGVADILGRLKDETEQMTAGLGIQGIARKIFDDENQFTGVPAYNQFLEAFVSFSGLDEEDYEVRVIDNTLEFITESEEEYQMDTFAGLTARLRGYVDKKSHVEIATMTAREIWGTIYVEAQIEKSIFLPEILREWESFWDQEQADTLTAAEDLADLQKRKEKSWRQFQVFMACYADTADHIQLAAQLDDIDLYSMAVLTMLGVLDAEACFEGYCEAEFKEEGWDNVKIGEEVFFVKESEW